MCKCINQALGLHPQHCIRNLHPPGRVPFLSYGPRAVLGRFWAGFRRILEGKRGGEKSRKILRNLIFPVQMFFFLGQWFLIQCQGCNYVLLPSWTSKMNEAHQEQGKSRGIDPPSSLPDARAAEGRRSAAGYDPQITPLPNYPTPVGLGGQGMYSF